MFLFAFSQWNSYRSMKIQLLWVSEKCTPLPSSVLFWKILFSWMINIFFLDSNMNLLHKRHFLIFSTLNNNFLGWEWTILFYFITLTLKFWGIRNSNCCTPLRNATDCNVTFSKFARLVWIVGSVWNDFKMFIINSIILSWDSMYWNMLFKMY